MTQTQQCDIFTFSSKIGQSLVFQMTELVTLQITSIVIWYQKDYIRISFAYILCCENGSGDPEELQECGGGGDGQAQHQHQKCTTAIGPWMVPAPEKHHCNSTFDGTSTREHR